MNYRAKKKRKNNMKPETKLHVMNKSREFENNSLKII